MKQCQHCKNWMQDNLAACPACGAPAPPQYTQPYPPPYPGQPYPSQPYPGQPYPSQPYPSQPYPQQAQPKKRGKGLLLALGALVVVLAIAGGIALGFVLNGRGSGQTLPPSASSLPALSPSPGVPGSTGESAQPLPSGDNWVWTMDPYLEYDQLMPVKNYQLTGTTYLSFINVHHNGKFGTLTFGGDTVFELYEGYELSVCGDYHAHHGPANIEFGEAGRAELEKRGFPLLFEGGHGGGLGSQIYYFPDEDGYYLAGGGEGPPNLYDEWDAASLPEYLVLAAFPKGVTAETYYDFNYDNPTYGIIRQSDLAVMVPADQDMYCNLPDGYIALQKGESWGFFSSKTGGMITDFLYEEPWARGDGNYYTSLGIFNSGLCPVRRNDKYGFINEQGQEVIPPIFEGATHVFKGCAWVKQNGLWGQIAIIQ